MKILLTGSTGFIGSHLLGRLTDEGHEVFCTTRQGRGLKLPGVTNIQADLSDPGWCGNLPDGMDSVIHLAQSSQYRNFPEQAQDIYDINIRSAFDLLEWCRKKKIEKLVMASTANVYAEKNTAFQEDDPCLPNSFYAASKLAAENMARQYSNFFQVCILRIFTVYGPGQSDALIPNIIRRVLDRQEIFLAGGVGLYLSPVYVDDAVRQIAGCLGRSRNMDIVNIAGCEIVTLKKICEIIGQITGQDPIFKNTTAAPVYLCGKSGNINFSVDLAGGLQKVCDSMR